MIRIGLLELAPTNRRGIAGLKLHCARLRISSHHCRELKGVEEHTVAYAHGFERAADPRPYATSPGERSFVSPTQCGTNARTCCIRSCGHNL